MTLSSVFPVDVTAGVARVPADDSGVCSAELFCSSSPSSLFDFRLRVTSSADDICPLKGISSESPE